MSANTSTELTALGIEPTFSAREAAVLLGRSYSWLDQRVRSDEFVLPEGSVVQPLRTPGGYRRFTLEMLEDIALSSYRHGWFSTSKLRSTFSELAVAAYGDTSKSSIGLRNAGQMVEPRLRLVDDLLAPRRHLVPIQQLDIAAYLKRTQIRVQPAHFSLGADLAAIRAEPRRSPTTGTRRLQLAPALDALSWSTCTFVVLKWVSRRYAQRIRLWRIAFGRV